MFFWLSAIVFFRRFKSFGIFFVKLSVIIFQLFDEFGSNVFVSNHQQPFFRAPCSACTIPNNVGKSIEFELRGLCERFWKAPLSPLSISFHRSGFDTDFMVNNDEETGLISYIGEIGDCFVGSSILMHRKEIYEDPVWPESLPMEYLCGKQPKNISGLLFWRLNDGDWWVVLMVKIFVWSTSQCAN